MRVGSTGRCAAAGLTLLVAMGSARAAHAEPTPQSLDENVPPALGVAGIIVAGLVSTGLGAYLLQAPHGDVGREVAGGWQVVTGIVTVAAAAPTVILSRERRNHGADSAVNRSRRGLYIAGMTVAPAPGGTGAAAVVTFRF